MNRTARTQRQYANATGDIWPTTARPITQLSDQNRLVRVRSK
jgi:hypothetical protein